MIRSTLLRSAARAKLADFAKTTLAAGPTLRNRRDSSDRPMQPIRLDARHASRGRRALHFTAADFNRTVQETLTKWHGIFARAKISEPLESISHILASALKTNNLAEVYKRRKHVLSDAQVRRVDAMCAKRLERMPVQHVVGEWDFRDINLKLRPPVFIPRPETETLVELALQDVRQRRVGRVLELCCGSGAICCSMLHAVKDLTAVTIDVSPDACALCEENATMLALDDRLTIVNCSVLDFAPAEQFDVIVSNPPYVLSKDMKDLQPEILLYEEAEALDGGVDGLDVIKQIFAVASGCLGADGRLFLEVDPSHPRLIRDLLAVAHPELVFHAAHEDLAGETRFVEIIKKDLVRK